MSDTFISMRESELKALLDERAHLAKQVDEVRSRMSEMVNASLGRQVRAFHVKFSHPVATSPCIPDEAQIRFRLALIAEEFFELLDACGIDTEETHCDYYIRHALEDESLALKVDLPEFVDALGDLDYVIEGTRAVFGIHAPPIAAEIQRANMDKDAVYVEEKDEFKKGTRVKPQKPEGWRPPDIAGELKKQGWKP